MMELELPVNIKFPESNKVIIEEPVPGNEIEVCDNSVSYFCTATNPYRQTSTSIPDQYLLYTFKTLIKKYKKQMGDSKDIRVVSGGLQQYINRQNAKQGAPVKNKQEELTNTSLFYALPVTIKLKIFSYLSAKELCRITRVCQDWYTLTQDNILWEKILQWDIKSWNIIGHMTNPALYQEVQSEWSNKEIYLRCSPEVNRLMHEENSMFHSLNNILKYFLPRKIPKVAMFGPGLESNTSGLVRNMLYENNTLLQRVSVLPGQFEGVGSGWCLRMENGQMFQLSVLYSAMKKEREQRRNRLEKNSLMDLKTNEMGEKVVELKPAVRDFCRTVDAFIYVVDASLENDIVGEGNNELYAMVNERWSATHVPVLVMSCIPDNSHSRLPCINVVDTLQISKMNRPWQVRDCVVQNLDGVVDSVQWLVEQSQRR